MQPKANQIAHRFARKKPHCQNANKATNESHEARDDASSGGNNTKITDLKLKFKNSNNNQTTLTQQGFFSTTSRTEEDEADDHFALCAAIKVSYVFSFIGLPGTPEYIRALKDAIHAHNMRWTLSVDECLPGKVPLDLGAETYKIQIATALRHNEPIEPFTSNIISHLKARRAKGTKCTEDEMLADAERYPWEFDEPSSDEESDEESDDGKPAAKKMRSG